MSEPGHALYQPTARVVNTKAELAASGFLWATVQAAWPRAQKPPAGSGPVTAPAVGVCNTEHTRVQTQRLQNMPSAKKHCLCVNCSEEAETIGSSKRLKSTFTFLSRRVTYVRPRWRGGVHLLDVGVVRDVPQRPAWPDSRRPSPGPLGALQALCPGASKLPGGPGGRMPPGTGGHRWRTG